MKLRPMAAFNANGVLKGNIIAVGDDGTPLGWECNTDWSRIANREKAIKSLVADTGITEDRARAAIAQAIKAARTIADDSPDEVDEEKSTVTARLPGLVDIVDHDGRAMFLFVSGGKLRVEERVSQDGKAYVPPQGDLLIPVRPLPRYDQVALHLSDGDEQLFADLTAWSMRASKLGPEYRHRLVALWILHTWFADAVAYTPYLVFYSRDGERGKSRQGKAIVAVSYRGLVTETLQEANLFRWADSYGNTIFFDVMDIWKKAERKGAEDLILGRFDKGGAKVARVVDPKLGPFADSRYFDVYGATVIGTNVAPHDLLQSRSIVITPPQAGGRYPNLTPEEALPLKERSCAFRARHLEAGLPKADKPADGRLGDILQPLAQVAALLGPDVVAEFAKTVTELETERQQAASESADARLVETVLKCVAAKELKDTDKLPNRVLTSFFNDGVPEKQQASSEKLGRRMTGLGFQPGKVDGDRARVIAPDLLLGLARKYGLTVPSETLEMEAYKILSKPSYRPDSFTPEAGQYEDSNDKPSRYGEAGRYEPTVLDTVHIQSEAGKDSRTVRTVGGKAPKTANVEGQTVVSGDAPAPGAGEPAPAVCSVCGGTLYCFGPDGAAYCERHEAQGAAPAAQSLRRCGIHGEVKHWERPSASGGGWVCSVCHPDPRASR